MVADGKKIASHAARDYDICVIDADGANFALLTSTAAALTRRGRRGKKIAYHFNGSDPQST